ncbi:chorismate mutase [Clostridium omnivorum]|uniref:Chorismate mutase n=1 Tax=Clostridium omnivorum TaxID=1604902 RepID=A0ABQ5N519_9CLOT|nr:chorismate mutase [Clostridium sp. E14]GLC30333.1 chorismate mutase [Clostridium sp. E14]
MNDISELRKEIDALDIKLVELFEARMGLSLNIAKYKKENNLQVLNQSREDEVINNCKKHLTYKELDTYLESFMKSLMDISKEYQKDFLSPKDNCR